FDRFSRIMDRLPTSRAQRMLLEMGLLDLASSEPVMPLGDLVERLDALAGGRAPGSPGPAMGGGASRGRGAPPSRGRGAPSRGAMPSMPTPSGAAKPHADAHAHPQSQPPPPEVGEPASAVGWPSPAIDRAAGLAREHTEISSAAPQPSRVEPS